MPTNGSDEIETVLCKHLDEAQAERCISCRGTRRKPLRGVGFLWANGTWRKERPPSEENIVYGTYELDNYGVRETTKPKVPRRKPVPKSFKPTGRTQLRERALSYAIQAAAAGRMGPVNGAEIIAAAEEIERWIADTPMEKS